MTAYKPIEAMQRLKAATFTAKQAEALANEMQLAIDEHVTRDEMNLSLKALKGDLTATIWTAAATVAGIGIASLSVAVSVILSS